MRLQSVVRPLMAMGLGIPASRQRLVMVDFFSRVAMTGMGCARGPSSATTRRVGIPSLTTICGRILWRTGYRSRTRRPDRLTD